MTREDRFMQPVSAIEVLSKAPVDTVLADDVFVNAKLRVEAGEDPELVSRELLYLDELLRASPQTKKLRTAAGAIALHRVADAHRPKFDVSARYAFAVARKALDVAAVRKAVEAQDTVALRGISAKVSEALGAALRDVLPKVVSACIAEGGTVTAKQVTEAKKK